MPTNPSQVASNWRHLLDRHDAQIGQFLDYLEVRHSRSITVEHALAWACLPGGGRSRWHAARLAAIRGFAAYVHAVHSADAELIPTCLIPRRVEHAVPYLYTAEQITDLIRQAMTLKPLVRGLTLATVIGVMASTGIRIGEALSLDTTSFDASRAQLTVTGKYRKVPPVTDSLLDRRGVDQLPAGQPTIGRPTAGSGVVPDVERNPGASGQRRASLPSGDDHVCAPGRAGEQPDCTIYDIPSP